MKTSTKVLLGVGGVAALGVLAWAYRGRSPLGYYEPGVMPRPTPVQETRAGNHTTRLYRARNISINERIGLIQDQIFKSINDPRMKWIAADVVRQCPERDGACEAKAVYNAVKARVRYAGDVAPIKHGRNGPKDAIDLYQVAWDTWSMGAGDCDDQSILLATLLALNGIEPRLRVTATSKREDWSHIYVVAGLPKYAPTKWIAVDSTLPGRRFGLEAPYGKFVDFDA